MKAFLAVFALCFVAVNAGTNAVNYESMVGEILSEIDQLAREATVALKHQVEEIVLYPLHQVEQAVENIDARRKDAESCVIAEEKHVAATVDNLHTDMATCSVVAAQTSAEIVTDVVGATQQLVFDGYSVLKTYLKCRNYTNTILQKSCYARLSIQAALYMKNARSSINTIRESINERIPAVFTDGRACTTNAADTALYELENAYAAIDVCAALIMP